MPLKLPIAELLGLAARITPYVDPRVGYAICEALGAHVGPRLPAYPRVCRNLRVLMPDASENERAKAARRMLGGMFKNYYDLFRFQRLSPAELDRTTVAAGEQHMHRALDKGRGVVLVAPHIGNYTVIFIPMIRRFDTRLLLVVEQLHDPRLHELMNKLRAVPNIEIVPLGPQVGRAALRTLRGNGIVLLGGDRAIAANALPVRFFGRPTLLPHGPASLALRTGAPLITGVTRRMADNRSQVQFDPPLLLESSGAFEERVRDATQKIAYIMQAYIRRDPAQWMVAEDVWPNA